jgi:hypothetical protein
MGLYQCEVCLNWVLDINYIETGDEMGDGYYDGKFICNDCITPYPVEDVAYEFIKLTNN